VYEEKSSLRLNIPVYADVNKRNVVQMEGINAKEAFADGRINKHSHKLWHQNKLGVRHQTNISACHQLKLCPRHKHRHQHLSTLNRKNLVRAFENNAREVYNVNANANDSQLKTI
jgi:hypothetical protein